MSPACVLHNIKSTIPTNFISNTDRSRQESSSNRKQQLNNNINNSNKDNINNISNINNIDNNSNNNNNQYNNRDKYNNNNENDKDSPLSSLNPVLNHRIYKKDSDIDDKSSNDSSINEIYSSDEMENRLTRYWYYPSSSTVTPCRYPKISYNQYNKNINFKSFKIMSFNTLAQSLVDYKYLENDQSTMSWCKRRNEILKVVSDSNSEIVCLQELDELDYNNFFKDKFEKLGYECVYKRKLQNRLDGILTMFKKDRYELVTKNELNFSSDHDEYDKPQVALIVALRDMYSNRTEDNNNNIYKDLENNNNKEKEKDDNTENIKENKDNNNNTNNNKEKTLEDILLVTNTHLIFNKSRGDVKLYQLLKLLSGVKETWESVVSYLKDKNNNKYVYNNNTNNNKEKEDNNTDNNQQEYLEPNILICGDFNITPQSLVYNLLFKGFAPLKNSNPRFLSGQYLMFNQTYLTSSSGHNESGETLGNIKHYISDVYSDYIQLYRDHSSDTTAVCSLKSYTPSLEAELNVSSQLNNNNNKENTKENNNNNKDNNNTTTNTNTNNNNREKDDNTENNKDNSLVSRIKALDVSQDVYSTNQFNSDWYNEVLKEVKKEYFIVKPEFVNDKDIEEFLDLVKEYTDKNVINNNKSDELLEHFRSKLNLGNNNSNNNNIYKDLENNNNKEKDDNTENIKENNKKEMYLNNNNNKDMYNKSDIIYCPFKLKSAYSADDGFNCEPAFTAYHGWQKGCVDYICYNPENSILEGIYEMPLYTKVKETGDLPHKKCPASDHFCLVSQFRRFR